MSKMNCLVSTVLLYVIAGVALAAEWTQPSIANSQRLIRKQYFDLMQSFCQAEDLSTSQTYTGVVTNNECVIMVGDSLMNASHYKVLTTSPGETVSWRYASLSLLAPPPAGAVPCSDPDIRGPCFLGASLYGDGICMESIGKIDLSTRMIYFADEDGKKTRCPFFKFLVLS